MCGRFVSSNSPDRIAEYFGASFDPPEDGGPSLPANFNVAPTNDVLAVVGTGGGGRAVQPFHWGLVPSWAKDTKIGSTMINARGETVGEKPAFKRPFRKHRVIIPMDGYYEWQQHGSGGAVTKAGKPAKQPFFIHRADGEPLAVAGLWATWRDKTAGSEAPWLHSCTIVTTAANVVMSAVHDRMPVLLPATNWDEWLDPENHDIAALQRLLVPAPEHLLVMHPVSTDVNNVRNKGAELVSEIDPTAVAPAPEGTLPLG
jgi:putative SOS response-associated peptidase YedK